jgi:hypothetical protein
MESQAQELEEDVDSEQVVAQLEGREGIDQSSSW